MSRRQKRKQKELLNNEQRPYDQGLYSVNFGRLFFRFLLLLLTTAIICCVGLYFFFKITFNGPSTHARSEMVKYTYNSSNLSFIPELFLSQDEIKEALYEQ